MRMCLQHSFMPPINLIQKESLSKILNGMMNLINNIQIYVMFRYAGFESVVSLQL